MLGRVLLGVGTVKLSSKNTCAGPEHPAGSDELEIASQEDTFRGVWIKWKQDREA